MEKWWENQIGAIFRIDAIDEEAPVNSEKHTWYERDEERRTERRSYSESVAVVLVLIDCQRDWVSRIYLAYAPTTPRNDARAYIAEIIRAVHTITPLSCENQFIDTAYRVFH